MNGISEAEVFAIIGRLYAENQMLRQQLILLQQQIAQGQVSQDEKPDGVLASMVSGKQKAD